MANTPKERAVPNWTPEKEMEAFRTIPEPDGRKAAELLPGLMEICTLLGRTQSMSWLWVLVSMATVSCQLSPKDRLDLCPSVQVHGALWTALLHPGSTNTSGFLKALHKAMELIYAWANHRELQAARAAYEQEVEIAEGNNVKPPKFVPPPKRKGTAGGGSLAAAGANAAQQQNRGSFTAIEPELNGILAWLVHESAVDSAVPGKLWDAVTWDRPVMSSAKAFEIADPFFSFVAAGHLHDLLHKLMQDSLGLRQRLTVVYARPLFLKLEEIEKACRELPVETNSRPQIFIARFLSPLLAWSLRAEDVNQDGDAPGVIFHPCAADGAKEMATAKFNFRNQKQRLHYLDSGSHGLAKYHGKLKTKYDRMALGVFYLHALAEHYKAMRAAGVSMDCPLLNWTFCTLHGRTCLRHGLPCCMHKVKSTSTLSTFRTRTSPKRSWSSPTSSPITVSWSGPR